jgi:CO/xanthine dehydrogenase Mo-binding subunit
MAAIWSHRSVSLGVGTFASRGAVVAGNATHAAAKQVRAKLLRTAAEHFECAEADLLLAGGQVAIKGVPQRQHHARSVGSAGQPAAWCGPAGDRTLYHQSDVTVRRHHTDGGGDAEHVFALLALLGFQFAPRIPDLKNRRLYSFAKSSVYPTLEPLIAAASMSH